MTKKQVRKLLVRALFLGALGAGINQFIQYGDRLLEKRHRLDQLKKEISDWSCSKEAMEMSLPEFIHALEQKWKFVELVSEFD